MATVKVLYDGEASHLEEYLKRHEEKDMLTTEHSCALEGVAKEFADVQRDHSSKGNNSVHLIQSWSPDESKKLSREQVHAMGIALAARFAPGHQFIVQTHDDQPHFHNHIMINPVSLETGKRIQNKLGNIRKARNLNDEIARENGLQVLPPQEKLTRPGPNERAKRIEAYRGRSYILDLSRKARFARSHATNYDEYLAILNAFDVQARIEPENITYFYPGRKHGKRGRNLDPDLDKAGLERRFAENLERIKKTPDLRMGLAEILKRAPDQLNLADKKDVSVSLISHRREERYTAPRSQVLDQSFIPVEVFKSAKTKSILDYCEREKIPLSQDAQGRTVLKGRETLEVTSHSWINHKNKTQGNVIDFVSNHRRVSLLHAVSVLTENPNLLLLERYAGEEQSHYRPFFIPEHDLAPRAEALLTLSRFLNRPSPRDGFAELFKKQRLQVGSSGFIRFFSERDGSQYTEYLPDSSGRFRQNRRGVKGAFYSNAKKARELELFAEPRSFLKYRADALSRRTEGSNGILALLEPSLESVHREVARSSHLRRISLIGGGDAESKPELQRFYEELKQSLDPFSIDVTFAWEPISLSQTLNGTARGADHGRSLDRSF